ncbi:hypothetical protein MPTK1_5g12570 [Marchantia polymorpha subsp. ruderalis]|uniref:Uncharacterized protein n=2 Tax=Marchantia polymorpha TaxID=3197 RepID=A0AAF6BHM8_MARPO|nr:hypothetical protein MARPO_0092s0050 [Marchantia polymorpha]BBN11512.1 hypothetical protein Mp_5g12570 [Marchantia polymorpha subsp. ruderalis]|eukprot:PTQ33089.1 hypothetical protein MARPO_0092s0050 [Marchantia polymorpha]
MILNEDREARTLWLWDGTGRDGRQDRRRYHRERLLRRLIPTAGRQRLGSRFDEVRCSDGISNSLSPAFHMSTRIGALCSSTDIHLAGR